MQIQTKIKIVCWKKFSILEDFFTSMISWNTWYARRRLVSAKFRKIPMKEATTDSSVGSFWDSQLGSTPKRYVKLRKGFTASTNDGCLTLWNAVLRIVQWTTHWQRSGEVMSVKADKGMRCGSWWWLLFVGRRFGRPPLCGSIKH